MTGGILRFGIGLGGRLGFGLGFAVAIARGLGLRRCWRRRGRRRGYLLNLGPRDEVGLGLPFLNLIVLFLEFERR